MSSTKRSQLELDTDPEVRSAYRAVCAAIVSASNYHDAITHKGYVPTYEQIYCYTELREKLSQAKFYLEEALTDGKNPRKS